MANNYPKPVASIERDVRNRFPNATVTVDVPGKPEGIWFIDIRLGDHWTMVQWKEGKGFGISTNPDPNGFGEGADEVYADERDAFRRIVSLLLGRSETSPPEAVRLRELRSLRGVSQVTLAEALGVQQANVSKIEGRADNILVSTLESVVTALGGTLEVVARFPDGTEQRLQFRDRQELAAPTVGQATAV